MRMLLLREAAGGVWGQVTCRHHRSDFTQPHALVVCQGALKISRIRDTFSIPDRGEVAFLEMEKQSWGLRAWGAG